MKSLQDYINTYRNIATNLNIGGDSAEILIQLLANATYINEVEQLAYAREASLETATLSNSKIQHCMDNMFSVFRGQCPRVLLRFRPTKYFSLNMFDTIVTSNSFKIYYLGYYSETGTNAEGSITESEGEERAFDEGVVYGPVNISPTEGNTGNEGVWTIVGLLAKDTVEKSWTTTLNNPYFVSCIEDGLSNDLWVKINDEYKTVTREFSNHIQEGKVFDLTITDFGSRLYLPEENQIANTQVSATWYKYSTLSDYNISELKKVVIKGTDMINFEEDFKNSISCEETTKGIIYIDSSAKDSVSSIHYKSNKDRFVNSLLRSNSDICSLLENKYPENVLKATYKFTSNDNGKNILDLYYIPNSGHVLTESQINEYREECLSYYVTEVLNIKTGKEYTAYFTVDYDLYNSQSDINLREEIENILNEYEYKFDVNFPEHEKEITSLISKISNIRSVNGINIIYKDRNNELQELDDIDLSISYFKIVLND